jgi:hypothetical protein
MVRLRVHERPDLRHGVSGDMTKPTRPTPMVYGAVGAGEPSSFAGSQTSQRSCESAL